MMADVVYAKTNASVMMPGGYAIQLRAGTHWRADDPFVLRRPDLFSSDSRYGMSYSSPEMQAASEAPGATETPGIEQATAAPGERRNARRPSE